MEIYLTMHHSKADWQQVDSANSHNAKRYDALCRLLLCLPLFVMLLCRRIIITRHSFWARELVLGTACLIYKAKPFQVPKTFISELHPETGMDMLLFQPTGMGKF